MKFLKNWSIDLAKVPAYVDFNNDFEEHFDYELAIMLSNYDKTDENDCPIISQESQTEFKKLLQRVNKETHTLPVKYAPRYGYGRRYADIPQETFADGNANP